MTNNTAVIIRANGSIEQTTLTAGDTYKTLSDAVGGYIECVTIENEIDMWVNEEGKLIDLPYNATATGFFWTSYGFMSDVIMGDVILTGSNVDDGETVGLNDGQIAWLNQMLSCFADAPVLTA